MNKTKRIKKLAAIVMMFIFLAEQVGYAGGLSLLSKDSLDEKTGYGLRIEKYKSSLSQQKDYISRKTSLETQRGVSKDSKKQELAKRNTQAKTNLNKNIDTNNRSTNKAAESLNTQIEKARSVTSKAIAKEDTAQAKDVAPAVNNDPAEEVIPTKEAQIDSENQKKEGSSKEKAKNITSEPVVKNEVVQTNEIPEAGNSNTHEDIIATQEDRADAENQKTESSLEESQEKEAESDYSAKEIASSSSQNTPLNEPVDDPVEPARTETVTLADGSIVIREYDADDNLTKEVTGLPYTTIHITEYSYDEDNKLEEKKVTCMPVGVTETWYYNDDGSVATFIRENPLYGIVPRVEIISYDYDEDGKLARTIEIDTHDDNIATEFDENGNKTHEKRVSLDGTTTITEFYDSGGGQKTETITSPDGRIKVRTFDENNNLIQEVETIPSGDLTQRDYNYDSSGNLIRETITITSGDTTIYEYDPAGILVKSTYTYASGGSHIYEYNDTGILICETIIEPDGSSHIYEYDDTGILICETHMNQDGSGYTYEYGATGLLVCVTQIEQYGATHIHDYYIDGYTVIRYTYICPCYGTTIFDYDINGSLVMKTWIDPYDGSSYIIGYGSYDTVVC